jgi:hypothetical protein
MMIDADRQDTGVIMYGVGDTKLTDWVSDFW